MDYRYKPQIVERSYNNGKKYRQFTITIPSAIAEAIGLTKKSLIAFEIAGAKRLIISIK